MQTDRRASRRSFLTQVAGGGLVIGAGLIFGTSGQAQKGTPSRQMVIDVDPNDPARPPSPPPPRPRAADRDSGPNSDPQGMGPMTRSTPHERFVICPGHSRCPR